MVRVERGEVLAVEGNDLIVRMADGTIRHFENIPESAKITVDGKTDGNSRHETWDEAPAHHNHDNHSADHFHRRDGNIWKGLAYHSANSQI